MCDTASRAEFIILPYGHLNPGSGGGEQIQFEGPNILSRIKEMTSSFMCVSAVDVQDSFENVLQNGRLNRKRPPPPIFFPKTFENLLGQPNLGFSSAGLGSCKDLALIPETKLFKLVGAKAQFLKICKNSPF